MKIKDKEVVGTVWLRRIKLWQMLNRSSRENLQQDLRKYWFDWNQVMSLHNIRFDADISLPSQTVKIVSYLPVERYPKHQLDRKGALKILRDVGLRPPSCLEVFQLASQCLESNFVLDILKSNGNRRIMCPTAINPELPDFYYFGLGEGQGSFYKEPYRIENGLMVFWGDKGDGGFTDPLLFKYYFPLLLGVVP